MFSILEKCIITSTIYTKYYGLNSVKLYLSYFFSCIRNLSDFAVRSLFFTEMPSGHLPHSVPPPLSLKRDNHPSTRCVWHGGPLEWSGENLSFSYFRVDRASFHRGPPVREKNRDGWVSRLVSWWKSTGGWWENGGDCSSGDARCEDKYWSDTHGREDKTCDIKPLRLRDVFPMCD